ncbi:MAG: hypothetical protein SOW61_02915 [Erysipelotrichaceae bacterium]|nr:hypothetical protein [Erysipelotrichaceae bacterium]
MLLINQIKLHLDEDESSLKKHLLKKLRISESELITYRIYSRSIDARKEPLLVYTLLVSLKNEKRYIGQKDVKEYVSYDREFKKINTDKRPVIIGYGPSGIFSALFLLEHGIKPIVFERGNRISIRKEEVYNFFNDGILNPESNVQFGEGGAGTFSDAKLTTRIKDPYIEYITDKFIEYGAKENIRYDAHPHIGTDEIQKIITSMTDDMASKGVDFHFGEAVKEFIIENNRIKGVITDKDTYYSDYVLLGIGHSSYDTIRQLYKCGVYMEPKDFSIGFRVEHPQNLINLNQYNDLRYLDILGPAEYFLRAKTSLDKGVYSFCMCPGGFVVPSSSDLNTIVTNGMSYSKRDNHLANSAILVQVSSEDFGDKLFDGFEYIHKLEKKAYDISGSYKALSSNIKDYINNTVNPLIFESSYSLGTVLYNFNNFFDEKLNKAFIEAFEYFDKRIPGFIDSGIMVGPETRSSCPVRIKRNELLESVSTNGLYPMGEGAGYAGGIMSSALDGIRVALKIIDILS